MQRIVVNRTRRTFLWSLIPGVIRVTPGYTKSTVGVVTTTLFSPVVNSCLAIPGGLTTVRWDSSYSLNFWRSVFFFRRSSMWQRVARYARTDETAFYCRRIASRKFSRELSFHFGNRTRLFRFCTRGVKNFCRALQNILNSYTSLTNVHCSKTDINNANWNSFLTSEPADFRASSLLYFPHERKLY